MTMFTAANFQLRYDNTHTFPFFETEDGGIYGYGHPDRSQFAANVNAYQRLCGMGDSDDCQPEDVAYRWAVPTEVDGEPAFLFYDTDRKPVQPSTPGAFPVTEVSL